MKKWLLTLLFASALVLSACGGGASDDSNDGAADSGDGATTETASGAEDIYKNNCASCHGGDLSGGMGPELTTVGADYSADEIADIIDNGFGSMPAVNMTADDRDAVSEWLASKK